MIQLALGQVFSWTEGMKSSALWVLLIAGSVCASAAKPKMISGERADGVASVQPATAVSGEFGTWTVSFTVGKEGIATSGGLRVQLPDSWHSGERNSANCLQASDPGAAHYISAKTFRRGVEIRTEVESEVKRALVKHAKVSLDGRNERYVFVVRVHVVRGELKQGDVISIVYGDTSGGSPGMLGGAIASIPEPVLVAVDTRGNGEFRLIQEFPIVRIHSGKPVELLFHAPSQAVVGKPTRMSVTLLDKEHNAVANSSKIRLSLRTGKAEFPKEVTIKKDKRYAEFDIVPPALGILRLSASVADSGLSALSNPMAVGKNLPDRQIYWGDLHSHARHSWDGVGDDSFGYARNVTGLDFYALSDHSIAPGGGLTKGLSESTWKEYNALTDAANEPGRFVTFHAYEASFGRPYGHHIVYFRGKPGPFIYPQKTTLEEFWKMLKQGDAVTIPHHTGKFPGGIDFGIHDARFRRNFEIFSGHGLSEAYDPGHPLSFEHSKFTSDARSLPAPTFAVDTWIRGLELSTIASSDDHRGQPGQPHYGLAAIRAKELTRDAVFQALYDRHTYGTSGTKILLDFQCNGASMGQGAGVRGRPEFVISVSGTDIIARVELLRHQKPQEKFEVIKIWKPNTLDFRASCEDADFQPGAVYYMRLAQKNTVRGKYVMAWSSPIWTESKK